MDYVTIAYAVIAALIYALVWYAKTWATTQPPEPFNAAKLIATLVVGGAVGVYFAITGTPLTGEGVEKQLILYGAVTALVETILKTLFAKLGVNYPGAT